ncbi:hypothetical protein L209DRAFT_198267 [Thermothelomyces heterothallicus CBS 203.75]
MFFFLLFPLLLLRSLLLLFSCVLYYHGHRNQEKYYHPSSAVCFSHTINTRSSVLFLPLLSIIKPLPVTAVVQPALPNVACRSQHCVKCVYLLSLMRPGGISPQPILRPGLLLATFLIAP